jgi:2-amino-4-hydroxy-6-hydroxymethyldihydropteridine diphosphokinase
MDELHHAYLSLGSNIEPENYLPKAIQSLKEHGQVSEISSAWESHAVGFDGPNFLNACVLFLTSLGAYDLKEQTIRQIEAEIGRIRTADKNFPRTIDIDIVLFDKEPLNVEFWDYAFVVVPLAELIPDFIHPSNGEKLARVAEQVRGRTWIVKRKDVNITSSSRKDIGTM